MAEPFKLEVVPEIDEPNQSSHDAGFEMLRMGLAALSKRALVALASLFSLLTAASAFWLWFLTPKPDVYQIVSLTIYSLFILAINYLVRVR